MSVPEKKGRVKAAKRPKSRRGNQLEDDDSSQTKIKKKEVTSQQVSSSALMDMLIGYVWGAYCPPGGSLWKLTFFPPQADENVSDIQQWPEIQILTVEAAQEAAIDTKPDGEVTDRIFSSPPSFTF